jgi:uncharacterized membrane protein
MYGLALGIILVLVPTESLIDIIVSIVGFTLIGVNGYRLYIEFRDRKNSSNETLFNVLGVLMGFILLVVNHYIVAIIAAAYILAFPLIDIVKDKGNKNTILNNLPRLIIGIVLLVGRFVIIDFIFSLVGVLLIIVSFLYLGYNYYLYRKSGVKIIK